jgi:hypothetical protein
MQYKSLYIKIIVLIIKLIPIFLFRRACMLTIDDYLRLKTHVQNTNGAVLHFHDTCGGQYISIENADDDTQRVIKEFLASLNLSAVFDDDKSGFTVK